MIRVLIVDDSVVVRQIISDSLKGDPGLEVVGMAPNGRVALEKIPEAKPDVITLDLEMPEMDGLTTLTELRKRHPHLPVVVFSTLTERGAASTLDALSRGANDYVCKPSGQKNIQNTVEKIRAELIPKIFALAKKAKPGLATRPAAGGPPKLAAAPPLGPIQLIVIAVSTGGPAALAEIIPKLPGSQRQPILIVQHMPPVFTEVLAQRLAATSSLKVRQAKHQEAIAPGTVLIAPGDYHMRVAGSPRDAWVTLDQQPVENGCRPAADPLFVSAAQIFGASVLGVVMTGLGRDGTKGATQLRKAGGTIWAQDEATSAVWGMPGSVVEAGLVSRILPLQGIASALAAVAAPGGGGAGPAASKR
jgi:two-component system chemotaxis response regulator CheB